MLMTKDPSRIINLLNFLSKMSEKIEEKDKKEESDKIIEVFGEMFGMFDQENIFYLVKCQEFDGKSLLSYINSQNVRLFRQREELIDLSVKIANLNNGGASEKAMDEVINNYKSGLASGVGLRDMINMIKERYPWPTSKMFIMILVSLVFCLLGISLFAFDLKTDIQFSLEMLETNKSIPLEYRQTFPEECKVRIRETACLEKCWDENHDVSSEPSNSAEYIDDMKTTGWFSVWHCVQPFLVTFLVFLSMNYRELNFKGVKRIFPEINNFPVPDCLDKSHWCSSYNILVCCCQLPFLLLWFALWFVMGTLGNCFLSLTSILPMPVFTHIYMLYLSVRGHIARSKPQFKREMEKIERKIENYEALGKTCFSN